MCVVSPSHFSSHTHSPDYGIIVVFHINHRTQYVPPYCTTTGANGWQVSCNLLIVVDCLKATDEDATTMC